jgi:serine/threonine protein kinase
MRFEFFVDDGDSPGQALWVSDGETVAEVVGRVCRAEDRPSSGYSLYLPNEANPLDGNAVLLTSGFREWQRFIVKRPPAPGPLSKSTSVRVPLRVYVDSSDIPMRKSLNPALELDKLPDILCLDGRDFDFLTLDGVPLDPKTKVAAVTEVRIRTRDDQPPEDFQALCQCPSVRPVNDEPLEGFDLEKAWEPGAAHKILLGLAYALVRIHSAGIVHNNLCPGSIFLNTDDEPFLAGFEFAFRVGSTPNFPLKNDYSAPEIAASSGDLGTPIDVYAFGVFAEWFTAQMAQIEPLLRQCRLPNPLHRPTAGTLVLFLTGTLFTPAAYWQRFPALPQAQLGVFRASEFAVLRQFTPSTAIIENGRHDRFILKKFVTADDQFVGDLVKMEPINFPSICQYLAIQVTPTPGGVEIQLQRQHEPNELGEMERFDLTTKHIIAYGIAKGIEYLAVHRFGHRNLCPANILLNRDDQPVLVGSPLSRRSPPGARDEIYAAPEARGDDVYSLGMILYSLFHGVEDACLHQESVRAQLKRGWRPPLAESVDLPARYASLIGDCWQPDLSRRPKIGDVLRRLEEEEFMSDIDVGRFRDYRERFSHGPA